MSRKQHRVRLAAADRTRLRQMIRQGRQSAWVLQRARILLQADASASGPGLTDAQVAAAVDVSARTVARVRAAWCARGWEALARTRRRTPPVPPKLDGAAEARLIAVACSRPPAGTARWTLRLLAKRVVELEIVEAISHETVRRTLKKTTSSPGAPSAS